MNKRQAILSCLTAVFTTALFLICAAPSSASLKAGAAVVDVSPDRASGIYLAGYTTRKSKDIHDPITARCAVLDDGKTRMAIITADVIGIFYADANKIAEKASQLSGVPAGNILVHAIHTHSAPDTQGLWGGSSKAYKLKLIDGAASCVQQASADMKPVSAWFSQGEAPGFSINRRNPDTKKADPALAVMELRDESGKAVFTLSNFACHAVVLGVDNLSMTADYVYYLRKKLEEERGGVALFVMRDIGDANPAAINKDVYDRGGGTFEMAEKLGNGLANEIVRLLSGAKKSEITIRIASKTILVPVENRQFLGFMKSGIIKRPLKNDSVETAVALVDLGPARIMTFPGEATSAVRAELENILPGEVKFFFGQTFDETGYILSPDEWDASRYEESMSAGKSFLGILRTSYEELTKELL